MKFKISRQGEATVVHLDGDIDEDIEHVLASVLTAVQTQDVIFDCTGVRKINSIGVKGWISGFEAIRRTLDTAFVGCPSAFVDMAVMVPAFVAKAPIRSFYAPFHCEDCRRDKALLIEVRNGAAVMPQNRSCDKCGQQLEADDELETDLEFVLAG